MLELLPIVGIFVIFYLLMIRPAQRRAKATAQLQRDLQVGDPVLTNAGIFGTVRGLKDDRLLVEIADGVVITLARQAVVGVPPVEEAQPAYADDELVEGEAVEEADPATADRPATSERASDAPHDIDTTESGDGSARPEGR